jgi:hypothetical protein
VPAHGATPPPAGGRILRDSWLGVLTYAIPPGLVDEAARARPGPGRRERLRLLPPRVTAYFVLGLCLFSGLPYAAVFCQVTAGLKLAAPATAALTRARRRLGEEPLKALFGLVCMPLAPCAGEWSHLRGLLVTAWDGTGIALADTPANAEAFGRPSAGGKRKGPPPAPLARVVMLIACGTRSALGAAAGPCRGRETGERALARQLLGCLRPGMLLLADKGFYSWALWNEAAATGADLLWRAKNGMHLPVIRELPDGSFLARVSDPRQVRRRLAKNGQRRRRGSSLPPDASPLPGGMTARVIEFTLALEEDDGSTRRQRYRLLTTLADHRAHPAGELAAAYARRWAIETGWREVKTYLSGPGRPLRGRTPDLARQEIWALLAVYQAVRTLIARAAAGAGLDPARISFTTALRAARDTMAAPRRRLAAALDDTETALLAALVPERPHRTCPRAVKRVPFTPFPAAGHGQQAPVSRHAAATITITAPPDHPPHPRPAPTGRKQRNQATLSHWHCFLGGWA